MNRVLLVDYSYVSIRFVDAGIKALLHYLASIVAKYPSIDKIAFVGDSSPYNRSQLYPMYKKNRPVNPKLEKILSFRKEIEDFLKLLRIDVYKGDSLEADDIIASFIKNYYSLDKLFLVANDSDLFQLYRWNSNIIFFGTNVEFGIEKVRKQFQGRDGYLSVEEIYRTAISLAVITAGHNNLPRVRKGVGPVKCLALYLKEDRSINRDLFTSEELEVVDLNTKLSILPYEDTVEHSDCVAEAIFRNKSRGYIPTIIKKLPYADDVIPTLLRLI